MKKFLAILLICISSLSVAFAGPKEYALYRTVRDKWYEEPAFWIVIGVIGLCVLIYNIVKDKK